MKKQKTAMILMLLEVIFGIPFENCFQSQFMRCIYFCSFWYTPCLWPSSVLPNFSIHFCQSWLWIAFCVCKHKTNSRAKICHFFKKSKGISQALKAIP